MWGDSSGLIRRILAAGPKSESRACSVIETPPDHAAAISEDASHLLVSLDDALGDVLSPIGMLDCLASDRQHVHGTDARTAP